MKYLDEKLIGARPQAESGDAQFVRQTMAAVKEARGRETFSRLARTESVTKKENVMTKLLTMPRTALAALGAGAVLATGGAAYAAVNWFGSDVATRQKSDVVYSLASQCPPSRVQAQQSGSTQNNTSAYKILKPELISERDLQLDELSTCEQRAIEGSLRQAMPEVYQPGDSYNGLYYPAGTYGTVASVSSSQVTVANVPVDHRDGPREVVTVTLSLRSDTLVTDLGKKASATSLQKGDHVYFIYQDAVRSGQNGDTRQAAPSADSTVRAIAKTQYDMVTIKEKVFQAANQGAFQVLKKSDAYGG